MKPFPIILAHGITRPDYLINVIFKRLNLPEWSLVTDFLHYFKGIASHLRKHGFEVYATSVSFAADLETRGRDLTREIQKILSDTGHEKIHIIGHSMGGLDARYMIVNEQMVDHVASVTTIGTPHLGASVADWFIANGFDKLISSLRRVINLEGFKSLTTASCRQFNDKARNAEASNPVVYQTYAGWQRRELTFLPFQKTWQITYEHEGENDGLVSVKSQHWQDQLVSDDGAVKIISQRDFPVPADHVNQMGWWHLSGSQRLEWWDWSVWQEKRQYELAIKNVYLKIAEEISSEAFHVSRSSKDKGVKIEDPRIEDRR